MTTRIAINGFGRIGRCVFRALYERGLQEHIQVVAINELADCETISYMLRYDSTHGRFSQDIKVEDDKLLVGNGPQQESIQILHHREIKALPWADLEVDIVLECTGQFSDRLELSAHLEQGAQRVLLSHPGHSDIDYTIIAGVNQNDLARNQHIISVGSCSTNCVIPILTVLDDAFGIDQGVTTTIHSAMNDQPVIDAYHSDLRRTRAAVASIIPVDTALPKGISRLMPHLEGRFESLHIRVPTLNVSAMDMSIQLKQDTDPQEINHLLRFNAENNLAGILGYSDEPHASVDFNHDPRSAVIDATQTRVSGRRLLKIMAWFDNEWGFANRMLDAVNAINATE